MAPNSNYISFLFLTTLLLPLQITARDSQFFSKVTHFHDNNNVKETEIPNKEGQEINKAEQQPVFTPETENSYGLYGHDSNEPPSTTTTTTTTNSYHPYKPEFEDTSKYPNNNKKYYNNNAYNKYYNKDAYEGNQYELSETKYTEEGYNNNNKHNKYYYNNNAANDRYRYNNNNNYNVNNNRYSYNTNAANNRFNGEKQGMSDTRFLEGGRYFHDIYAEKEYNPTSLYGDSSRGVNTNNWHNNRGNNYGNYNGYQNQEEFEDEQQDEFQP